VLPHQEAALPGLREPPGRGLLSPVVVGRTQLVLIDLIALSAEEPLDIDPGHAELDLPVSLLRERGHGRRLPGPLLLLLLLADVGGHLLDLLLGLLHRPVDAVCGPAAQQQEHSEHDREDEPDVRLRWWTGRAARATGAVVLVIIIPRPAARA